MKGWKPKYTPKHVDAKKDIFAMETGWYVGWRGHFFPDDCFASRDEAMGACLRREATELNYTLSLINGILAARGE